MFVEDAREKTYGWGILECWPHDCFIGRCERFLLFAPCCLVPLSFVVICVHVLLCWLCVCVVYVSWGEYRVNII